MALKARIIPLIFFNLKKLYRFYYKVSPFMYLKTIVIYWLYFLQYFS